MSVHVKRVPQVLSGDNFPAVDPEDGTYFIFNVAQTSFLSSKTVRNDADSADVTTANEGDMFRYVASGTKWVREYQKLPVRTNEEIRDLIAGFITAGNDIIIEHDDAGNTLTFRIGNRTNIGNWQYIISSGEPPGGYFKLTATEIQISKTDSSSNDKNTALSNVSVGDKIFLRKTLNASITRTYTITSITENTNSWTFTGTSEGDALSEWSAANSGTIFHETAASFQRTDEDIRDLIASFITQGSNVTVTHDDAGNTLTIDAAIDTEAVSDGVGDLIQRDANGGIDVNYDDANNRLTLSLTQQTPLGTWRSRAAGSTLSDGEVEIDGANNEIVVRIQDFAGNDQTPLLNTVAVGDQIHIDSGSDDLYLRVTAAPTIDSESYTFPIDLLPGSTAFADFIVNGIDTLTLLKPVASTRRTDEEIRDLIAGFITQGTNVTVTHDDAGDTLTIDAAAAVPGATTLYGSVSTNYTTTGSNESLDANRSFADHNLIIFYVTAHSSSPRLVVYAVDRSTFETTGHQLRLYAGTAYINIERVNDTTFQVPWRNSSSSDYVALAMIQGL